jgi:flagellar biosynthesis GTPase FlhF
MESPTRSSLLDARGTPAGATRRAAIHDDALGGAPGGARAGRLPLDAPHADALESGARDVRDRLLEHGASADLVRRVLARLSDRGARGTHAIDAAARVLGASFPILPSPKRPRASSRPHGIAFVGPTGAGKTTTLAKLGRRLSEAGLRVAFASLDGAGSGLLDRAGKLESDLDRTELPLVVLRGGADLRAAWRGRTPDVVLLDTPGLSPRDGAELDGLARELERLSAWAPIDAYLVLAATQSRASLALCMRAFARTAPVGSVLTKLDETDQPAGVLEEVGRARLPVAFLCDGQDVRAHLARPSHDRLADLLLRGRYA